MPEHSSPHARRSFPRSCRVDRMSRLFSARAEVIPVGSAWRDRRGTLLRTRGGHSEVWEAAKAEADSSPHARRSFLVVGALGLKQGLFSARAEVIPALRER